MPLSNPIQGNPTLRATVAGRLSRRSDGYLMDKMVVGREWVQFRFLSVRSTRCFCWHWGKNRAVKIVEAVQDTPGSGGPTGAEL